MAGHGTFTALLDANVLYPIAVCDALLSVACTGIYAAKWSRRIEDEWIRNLSSNSGHPPNAFHRRRDLMRIACPDWEVNEAAWKQLEHSLNLPDKNDSHVLAAAIVGHADVIVTCNLKHFPSDVLRSFALDAIHPDSFLHEQLQLQPQTVLAAFKKMRGRKRNPPYTAPDFVSALHRNGLPLTAQYLGRNQDSI